VRLPGAILLALVLADGAGAAAAQDRCAAPPVWSAPEARRGRPNQELSACLHSEAYKIRDLKIPLSSAANGIVAICEVEIDRIEGAFVFDDATWPRERRLAVERDVMGQATAAVTQYRACAGR
jgi:hypothetical protein